MVRRTINNTPLVPHTVVVGSQFIVTKIMFTSASMRESRFRLSRSTSKQFVYEGVCGMYQLIPCTLSNSILIQDFEADDMQK